MFSLMGWLRIAAPYIAGALVIVAAWMWGYMARGTAEAGRAAKAAAAVQEAADERLAAALGAQQAAHAEQLAAAERRAKARNVAARAVDDIVQEIKDEPTTTVCLNSPAVVRALGRLRALETARSDAGN